MPHPKHNELIKFFNEKFDRIEKTNKGRRSNSFTKKDTNTINNAVQLLVAFFNLSGGSAGEFDFYELLQQYMMDKNKRKEIHKILNINR
ncbi:hypothetical protein D0817_24680 [Flavobacterium cupreum]|uniref:Uncharacterized protein n=1 Tax=Flavobacterium cupreum TaxID=2133766 RepID=A0A434A062_9FLAO|nr:hypothetical protein [Flavobacterium cupreum]RUT67762.1 hypothetical protein D0817_24680 [Flavobacterium cupreum]